jgi:imidazolonepropionase-like amidohydrolase
MLGMSDRVGSIEVGKAGMWLLNRKPFDIETKVVYTILTSSPP